VGNGIGEAIMGDYDTPLQQSAPPPSDTNDILGEGSPGLAGYPTVAPNPQFKNYRFFMDQDGASYGAGDDQPPTTDAIPGAIAPSPGDATNGIDMSAGDGTVPVANPNGSTEEVVVTASRWPEFDGILGPQFDAMSNKIGMDLTNVLKESTTRTNSNGNVTRSPNRLSIYDKLHDVLNTPAGAKALDLTQQFAKSLETNASQAAAVASTGIIASVANDDPASAEANELLLGAASSVQLGGKLLDLAASYLKSVQQDNNVPLKQAAPRVILPDFTDLHDLKP
jgi:hypothetical protein